MAFRPLPGNKGMIYIPDDVRPGRKKHPCPDCFACQWCGNERCRACQSRRCGKCRKAPESDRQGNGNHTAASGRRSGRR
jgi:hypothetical protein